MSAIASRMKAAFDLRRAPEAAHQPTTDRDCDSLSTTGLLRRTRLDQKTMCGPVRTWRAKNDPPLGKEFRPAVDTVSEGSAARLRRPRRTNRRRRATAPTPLLARRLSERKGIAAKRFA